MARVGLHGPTPTSCVAELGVRTPGGAPQQAHMQATARHEDCAAKDCHWRTTALPTRPCMHACMNRIPTLTVASVQSCQSHHLPAHCCIPGIRPHVLPSSPILHALYHHVRHWAVPGAVLPGWLVPVFLPIEAPTPAYLFAPDRMCESPRMGPPSNLAHQSVSARHHKRVMQVVQSFKGASCAGDPAAAVPPELHQHSVLLAPASSCRLRPLGKWERCCLPFSV